MNKSQNFPIFIFISFSLLIVQQLKKTVRNITRMKLGDSIQCQLSRQAIDKGNKEVSVATRRELQHSENIFVTAFYSRWNSEA